MLTEDEREKVLQAISAYGFLGRGEVDKARDRADADLPYDLIARAAVEDPVAKVRWAAVDLLDHYADDKHTDALLAAATDPVPRVRQHAVHALGCTTCNRTPLCIDAVPVLVERALNDESAKVRRHASWALMVRLPDERALTALTQMSRLDPDNRTRNDVARALKPARARTG